MHPLRFYLPLQRVEDGLVFFAPGGVGPVPQELHQYPTIVVSTNPQNEEQLVVVRDKGNKLSPTVRKDSKKKRQQSKTHARERDSQSGADGQDGQSDARSPIDESDYEVCTNDNAKSTRALQEAQAVARRLITLTKETDGNGFAQGEEAQLQSEKPKTGIIISTSGSVYVPMENTRRQIPHVSGPMLSRVLAI